MWLWQLNIITCPDHFLISLQEIEPRGIISFNKYFTCVNVFQMMCFARHLFEQERRLKQYQEMILCPLYLTPCQLSIAYYKKHRISANDLKYNKCFPKEIYNIWFDTKTYNFRLSWTFCLGSQSDVVVQGWKISHFLNIVELYCPRAILYLTSAASHIRVEKFNECQ